VSRWRDNLKLGTRGARALYAAGVVRPLPPATLRRVIQTGRRLQATPAASIAIAAARAPDGLAVADERGALTWGQLDRRVRALAGGLIDDYGAGPSRPVAIMCRNHRGALEALGAAARTGADVLALNTEFAPPQIAAALRNRTPAVVVHDEEFAERLNAAAIETPGLLAFAEEGDARWDALADSGRDFDEPVARRSQITILTSGTTGAPKAAARDLPARAMLGAMTTLIEQLGLRAGAPVLVAPPLFHGFGLGVAAIAQALGAPVVLRRRFDPEAALEQIERHRVACMVAVPVMLARILDLAPDRRDSYDRSSLRAVLSAGAPLAPALSDRFMVAFGDILHNGYGSTETGFGAIAGPTELRRSPGTVGHAPLGASIQILDEDRRPCPPGVTGHVFVGGDLVFDGYADGGSKETAAGLMNTGDLGHVDGAGCVHIEGREDDMIVSGGENVFPQEVEDALGAHPGVREAAVVGVPDAEFGQRLLAFVVLRASETPTAATLEAHLRGRLERYKLPREIVVLDEIPRTATGKVIRHALTTPPRAAGGNRDRPGQSARQAETATYTGPSAEGR